MISNFNKNILQQIDVRLILRISLLTGCVFLFLGYVLNDNLVSTLRRNISVNGAKVKGVTSFTLIKPSDTTNELNLQNPLQRPLKLCSFIPKDKSILSSASDQLALVTKNIGFLEIPDYEDIVYLKDFDVPTYEFTRLRKEPAEKLGEMFAAMKAEKLTPFVSSGYRTEADQIKNLNNWNAAVGSAKGGTYAARPGFSEHHLGTTIDILTDENYQRLMPTYENTKVFKWLSENAYKYGFVMSYPKGSENITGYVYEPWHYRYVGVELALLCQKNNLLLQEYLYQLNNYCLAE